MAKNGLAKYQKKKKHIKKVSAIDFKILISEFDKLLGKKFIFILGNGEIVTFTIEEKHFCHMLGFDKIIDATIIELLGRVGLKKMNFYNYVKDGYVNYDYIDLKGLLTENYMDRLNAINFNFDSIKTFADTNHTSIMADVKNQRWLTFTEESLLSIFHNELVIDFDYNKHFSKVPADKIFFRYNVKSKKNLNLFISYEDNKYFVRTFFLEKSKDEYMDKFVQKPDGSYLKVGKQSIEDILINVHVDKVNSAEINTTINWNNIRKKFKKDDIYRPVQRLKNNFKMQNLNREEVGQGINDIEKTLINLSKDIETIQSDIEIKKYFDDYIATESEDSILFFTELGAEGVEIEDIETHAQYENIDSDKLDKTIIRLTMKITSLETKRIKFIKFLPLLKDLEACEIRYIFAFFFDTTKWTSLFIEENFDLLRHPDDNLVLDKVCEITGEKIKIKY